MGIDLNNDNVTPNDAGDSDTGANNLQNYPVITQANLTSVQGTLNSTANTAFTVQFFSNPTCDNSGNGEGKTYLGQLTSVTTNASGNATFTFTPAAPLSAGTVVTATATDSSGNTSEFSACRVVNQPPSITAGAALTRQQCNPSGPAVTVATVSDAEDAAGTLTVAAIAGGTATGVTLGSITNTNGTIMATVAASCTATTGTVRLQVTDSGGGTATSDLQVNVTANTPPTLGTYPSAGTINAGTSSTTVTPNAVPSDNGTVSTLTASAPSFTGSFVGNPATGVVTINNAGPAGNYTVTVTATDNCGATATKTFSLTVNGPPTISGKTVSLQAGATATNVAIATVNDDLTPRQNLAVTVAPPLPLGITVTAISVNPAGKVTATVAADCLAGTGNNNVTLRVTDGNGLTAQANLTVNVIPFYSYAGGLADNFAAPADVAYRRTALNNVLPFASRKNFDVITLSRSVGHSFINLPANITKAELEVRMKPSGAASADDTLKLGLNLPNTFAYSSAITSLPGTGGTWVSNLPVTFTLDLSNLPGGGDILSKVIAEQVLDVVIGTDTTVDYLKLSIYTCPSGLIFGGTPTTRRGTASFTTNADGSLTLGGLNAPGLHGYELNLGQAEGASVILTPGSDLRVNGDSIGVQHKGPPPEGGDAQVFASATLAGNGTNVIYRVDFSGINSTQSLYEFRNSNGTLLRSFVAPNDSPLTFVTGGSPYLTAAKAYSDSRSNTAKATMADPVTVLDPTNLTTPGVTEISVTALQPTTTIAFVSSTVVLAHSSGGSIQSSNPGVVMFGNEFLTAHPLLPGETQPATLTPAGGALTVANIGSSGEDGVVADLGRSIRSRLTAPPKATQAEVRASIQLAATGFKTGGGNPLRVGWKSTKTATGFSLIADYSQLGASTTQHVQVFSNNVAVGNVTGFTGTVGATSTWTSVTSSVTPPAAALRASLAAESFSFDSFYPASTVFTVNGTDYIGDELRVIAEGATTTMDFLTSMELTAADIPEFTILDVQSVLADNPPTISAVAVARQAGSPSASATIANVNDTEDAKNALIVKVNNATTATVNGVTVSGLNVDSAGAVTANVVAACGATNASFALTVIDSSNSR